ncbi:MAG TPA: PEP-CTERM sorting domain-containing protein [Chthonomonadaceae bacterium]|nr:PEP-CTERM sorting domain-containing protein [Chthonomonadaceae bacterium]
MRTSVLLPLALICVVATVPASAQSPVLFGGNGGHSQPPSINEGWLVRINQTDASVTPIGHPDGVARLSGLAFDATGALFGATQVAGGFPPPPGPLSTSDLIRINPLTGSLVSNIGPITAGGKGISIADLAVQPGTDALFGVESPQDGLGQQGNLYRIDKQTGVATLLGNTGFFFDSIAFAPDGTLYLASANLGPRGTVADIGLRTLDPTNALILSSVTTNDFFGALGVRPTDGVIFGGTGDTHMIFTIDPVNGAETLVGDTGNNFIGAFAFSVPEPGALSLLLGLGLSGAGFAARRRRRR